MVKLIGIILIFTGCSAIGFLKAFDFRKRRVLLVDFKDLLLRISTEIGYFKEPLPLIFQKLSRGLPEETETALLLRNCLTAYQTEAIEFDRIWKNGVEFVYEKLPLTGEDIEIMKKCGDFLGQSDFSRQQEYFRLINLQLDRQIEEAIRVIDSRGKLYSRMGISVGMMIAIVLI